MRRTLMTLTVAGSLLLAGCGGADEEAPEAGGGAPTEDCGEVDASIRVGAIPIVDVAPLYLGIEQGIFSDAGLEVEAFLAQGGAAIVPAVVNGEAQFGVSNITSLLQAEGRGVPLALVAPNSGASGNAEDDYAAVIVAGDSPYQSAADLDGTRIGINSINNISDTVVRESVRQAGGDPDSIEFVEIPFPDMVSAVSSGQVDGVFAVEPFVTLGERAGLRAVSFPYTETDEDLLVAGWFTSDQFVQEEPCVVQAFTEAMVEAQQYAQDNPDAVREVLGTYTQIPPDVAQELTLPAYPTEINRESVELLLDLGEQDGIVEGEVDLDNLIVE
ncbi:ABC transporter substrate-binding protein [Geodermatophilus marinus]|uniref:ABC transporter substrate-binding protein n=1 Tax=Geodermatophilus sp. LHW52908 TaxID=2303986 RepID=UPI000E3CDA81|nr:ABC transporter substrate-binding protein [Geodermatophilus sp. LHW52908]RFU19874.1 nitrate ABC transporter substrate-binding protein [Geodermatophilus sp. LHW52908]